MTTERTSDHRRILEQADVLQRLVALTPDDPALQFTLAQTLARLGQHEESLRHYRRCVELNPSHPGAHNNLGSALYECGHFEEAQSAYLEAARLAPNLTAPLKNLGMMHVRRGDNSTAEQYLRRAIALDPGNVSAYLTLSSVKRFEPGDPDLAALERLAESPRHSPEAQMKCHFALGKAYDDLGEHGRAFHHYTLGNSIQRRTFDYSPQKTAAAVDQIREFFSPDRFAEVGGQMANPSELPVFVVGMPRSGTTLVEQILDNHPSIVGGGELPLLAQLVTSVKSASGASRPFPECLLDLNRDNARQIADHYVRHLTSIGAGAQRVTDKMPWNFFVVGLIALLWPKAKIIHCLRDPLDTCVSCYLRSFARGHEYSSDLRELGHYYVQYQRLAEHWRQVLPGKILEIRYEDVVSDPEANMRRIIGNIGLPWNDRCLDFHENRRLTRTSEGGVRRPLYTSSIGSWRRFAEYLGPLRDSLGIQDGLHELASAVTPGTR